MRNIQKTTTSINKTLSLLKPKEKILVVVGKRSYKKNVLYKNILINFKAKILLFRTEDSLPLFKIAKYISQKINNEDIKNIVAIGGGTVIDTAKLIKFLYLNKNSNFHSLPKNISLEKNKKVNLIVAPTTAGSGAEATQFCVSFYYKKKTSISHSTILPNFIYFNPESLLSNSIESKLSSGLDALSQCIESLLSINCNKESSLFAIKGLKLILKNFEKYLINGDVRSANNMQIAAHLSGKAINISKTSAPHAFSYYLTSHHKVPHGFAVAVFLPYFFNFLVDNIDQIKSAEIRVNLKKIVIEFRNYSHDKNFFLEFYNKIGFNTKYLSLLKDYYDLNNFVKYINIERLKNFPLDIRKYGSKNILENIFRNNNI